MSTIHVDTYRIKKVAVEYDRQVVVEIYEHYSPEIFRYAYRMLNESEFAEDCVSETFHRLLIAIRSGKEIENMRAYLYRIAHNWITDHFRRHPVPAVPLEEEMHYDPENNPSNLVAHEMDRQRVRAALLQLTPEQRLVIELRFLENWSHEDVANLLGRTVEATRALQYRAVESLRHILSE
jgi:RNA polymerase sigma-70 factor (ECF subfamily)